MDKSKAIKAGRIIVKSGILPFPITDTLIEIMEVLYTEEEVDFILKAFARKPSLNMEELVKKTKLTEEKINQITDALAKKGAVFKQPNSAGIMVIRILPLITVGIFEYTFMKQLEFNEREKKLADLFESLFVEVNEVIQEKYDQMLSIFKTIPPTDRTVPILETVEGEEIKVEVNEEIELSPEQVLPSQKVSEIIDKFDEIAVAHCFCRQHKLLLDHECELDPPQESCFTFGKSARFVSEQGFGRLISKEEAKQIIKKCAEAGLVHKAYHPHGNISKEETSLCNCCKDCCGTISLWKRGTTPMVNATNYLAITDSDLCTGCGTCVERCPVDAIELDNNNKAKRNADWCIGCGICARFCPEGAISLLEGSRTVFVLPPKIR